MLSGYLSLVQENGVRATSAQALGTARRATFADERLIVILKDLDAIVASTRQPDLRVEELDPSQQPALSKLNARRGRPDIDARFARYLREGFHGFVAYLAQEAIGYYWWVDEAGADRFPDLSKLGLQIELSPGDVYGSDMFLLEQHRGGGIAAQMLLEIESALRDRGYKRIWGYVASDNRSARWLYSVRGYQPMWIINRRKFLFLQRTNRESA